MSRKIELLAPAGDIYRGQIALDFGADAIYFGGKQYSLRARASNFDYDELREMINITHNLNKKAYIVTNILCHNIHLNNLNTFFQKLISFKPDGFICADPAIIQKIRSIDKQIPIHISTQQSVTNSKAALFWKRNNANRVVLAREISHKELKELVKNINHQVELEYFIHGAVCVAYSGRCVLSNNYCMRDANIGGCAQSCRWKYNLSSAEHNYANNFSMSAKDMNQISNLKKILELGIDSLKIEGRMKKEHYLATVCCSYSNAINEFLQENKITHLKRWKQELNKIANREVNDAWFNGKPKNNAMLDSAVEKQVNQNYAFIIKKVINHNTWEILSKNYFTVNNHFEVFGRDYLPIKFKIKKITDKENNSLSVVNTPFRVYLIKVNKKLTKIHTNDMVRIIN